jgi:outer membrane protein OmpA-like peptidoglycan-associated protein
LSADGQTLIFTACEVDGEWGKDRTGIASCDLFFTIKSGNGWSPAKNLGTMVNTGVWESQPSFSADGRTLYFVRGKNVGRGIQEQDIYYSVLNSEQKWTKAEKIPGKVNTIFEESSVMIHPDGRTLYFSSNGHSGMGGMDIYMSRMLPDGSWDKPINLGYPINTAGQEDSFQVTADGTFALFSSTREGGFGKADLYSFDMPESIRPKQVSYVKGVVSDKLSYKKLEAHLELIDLETGKVVVESYSNAGNGEFLVCLPTGKDYALNVSRSGYIFHSENFSLKNYTSLKPYQLDIKLQKLRPGSSIVLNNVFFETNSFDLKPESKVELDKLAELMKLNPTMKFELGGHTDNVGADENNLTLSQNRANNVVKYLVSKGIPADKLVAVGYGESKPVDTNDTEEGRKKNRRTEFKILE